MKDLYEESVKLTADASFPKFRFASESLHFIIGNTYRQLLSTKWQAPT